MITMMFNILAAAVGENTAVPPPPPAPPPPAAAGRQGAPQEGAINPTTSHTRTSLPKYWVCYAVPITYLFEHSIHFSIKF